MGYYTAAPCRGEHSRHLALRCRRAFIERLSRSVKFEEVHLRAYTNGIDARMSPNGYS